MDLSKTSSINLPFESRESAAAKIKNILSQLNINYNPDYVCYALDHNTLQTEADKIMKNQQSNSLQLNFDESFDSYVFYFTPTVDNIAVSSREYGNAKGGNTVYGSNIRIIYNKAGILELRINQVYDFAEVQSEQIKILTAQEALQPVIQYYNQIIHIAPLEITEMNLEYLYTNYIEVSIPLYIALTFPILVQGYFIIM